MARRSAEKGRLRPSFFFLIGALGAAAAAQQAVYRCGQEYTNAPLDASRCERVAPQAVTVIPGTRVQVPAVPAPATAATVPAGRQPPPARIEAAGQKQRDDMARAIVAAELDKARQRHDALLQDQQKAQGKPDEAPLKAAVERARRDIDSLQRELERRPVVAAQP